MTTGTLEEGAQSLMTAVAACAADDRPEKIDLTVGVYKDRDGRTPIMRAIRLAEARVLQQQATKSYIALSGRDTFSTAILDLVLGTSGARYRAGALQSVGGSGALRMLLELVKRSSPGATIWMSHPGYPGHFAIARGVGLDIRPYPYEVTPQGTLRADVVLDTLAGAKRGDVVILDASCHNPTGVDLSADVWRAVGELCARNGLVPLVDVAYQGLANDVTADVAGLAELTSVVDRAFVAVSCSKTFGVYRERAGAAIVMGPTRDAIASVMQSLVAISFSMYAVPPDHGAALVEAVLSDASLRAMWQDELQSMNEHLRNCRRQLADAIEQNTDAVSVEHIRRGHGLFSLLPLNAPQMRELRERFAIHGLENGRIALTGVNESQLQTVARAVRAVL
jgi:aspartate aminotransferase